MDVCQGVRIKGGMDVYDRMDVWRPWRDRRIDGCMGLTLLADIIDRPKQHNSKIVNDKLSESYNIYNLNE